MPDVADALKLPAKNCGIIVKGKDYLWMQKQPADLEREILKYVQDGTLRKAWTVKEKQRKNRDRIETEPLIHGDVAWLYGKEKWKNLNCVAQLKRI